MRRKNNFFWVKASSADEKIGRMQHLGRQTGGQKNEGMVSRYLDVHGVAKIVKPHAPSKELHAKQRVNVEEEEEEEHEVAHLDRSYDN